MWKFEGFVERVYSIRLYCYHEINRVCSYHEHNSIKPSDSTFRTTTISVNSFVNYLPLVSATSALLLLPIGGTNHHQSPPQSSCLPQQIPQRSRSPFSITSDQQSGLLISHFPDSLLPVSFDDCHKILGQSHRLLTQKQLHTKCRLPTQANDEWTPISSNCKSSIISNYSLVIFNKRSIQREQLSLVYLNEKCSCGKISR